MAAYVGRLAGIGHVAALGVWRRWVCGGVRRVAHRVRWACGRRRHSAWVGVVSDVGAWRRGHVGCRACDVVVTGPAGHRARAHDVWLVLHCACDVAIAGPYWTSGTWPSLGSVRCKVCGDVIVS
jgi:hypothetical protein